MLWINNNEIYLTDVGTQKNRPLCSIIFINKEYYIYHGTSVLRKDLILKSPDLGCLILGRADRNLARNEFRAGDYLRFGRVWYHVKETSTHPIECAEEGEASEESDKSLDNTHADAVQAAQNNASVLASETHISRMGRVAVAMARQQIAGRARRAGDASPVSVPAGHQHKLSGSAQQFGDALNRTDECSVSELEGQTQK
jgi:hypothetical protein